uniref:Uncharacterized protein n=1 Tax=Manihot esculenta TaxID=3983 RepID=A0A2C9VLG9_MANES
MVSLTGSMFFPATATLPIRFFTKARQKRGPFLYLFFLFPLFLISSVCLLGSWPAFCKCF